MHPKPKKNPIYILLKAMQPLVEWVFNAPAFCKLRRPAARRRAYLLLTADYLNYGDHAIAWAEEEYLKNYFPEFELVEIAYSFYDFWPEKFEKAVRQDDLLLITGGGFMGGLWPYSQQLINSIVEKFPNNKIIIFPQSIYFPEKKSDNEIYSKIREIFLDHTKLWLFVREENSFRIATQHLLPEKRDRCFLVPDIVLSMPEQSFRVKRKQVLLIFRDDQERTVSADLQRQVAEHLKRSSVPYRRTAMAHKYAAIPTLLRKPFLNYKLRQYARARVVITDRLHGMVLAYLTRTPCLAFDNVSKKVSGVYRWIESCPWVQIAREDWQTQLNELLADPSAKCEGIDLTDKFEPLRHLLDTFRQEKNK